MLFFEMMTLSFVVSNGSGAIWKPERVRLYSTSA